MNNNSTNQTIPNLSRKELIYMTKIYTKSHKYDEAIDFSIQYIHLNPKLTTDERNLFITAFKYSVTKKRSSWRKLRNQEKKELKESILNNVKSPNLEYLKEIRHKIEKELRTLISNMIGIVTEVLIPACESEDSIEAVVCYLKLRGDYFRYLAEITGGEDHDASVENADESYSQAFQIAEETLAETNVTRLGLALNYSVFLWEVKQMHQEAAEVAQNAFNLVVDKFDAFEKSKAKDALLIIQLLRENLLLWSKQFEEGGLIVQSGEQGEEMGDSQGNEIMELEGIN